MGKVGDKVAEVAARRTAIMTASAAGHAVFPGLGLITGGLTGFFMSNGNPLYLIGIGWADEAKDAADIAIAVADSGTDTADVASTVWTTGDTSTYGSHTGTYADNDGHGNPDDRNIHGNRPTDVHGNNPNGTVHGRPMDGYGNPT